MRRNTTGLRGSIIGIDVFLPRTLKALFEGNILKDKLVKMSKKRIRRWLSE